MQILPKIRVRFGEGVGAEVFVTAPDLQENNGTNLAADTSASVSSFTVDNGNKLSASTYAVVGSVGSGKTEIVRLSSVTATVLSLSGSTSFAHNRGEKVVFIPYNQVVIERSTDSGSTYAELATVSLRADALETFYAYTSGTSTDYYRARFKNSTDTTYSQYSDGIISTGYAENSAGAVIREAMIGLGEKYDTILTKEFMFSALREGRQEVDKAPGAGRWSFRTEFDYDAGNVIPGHDRISVPSTLRRPDTYEHILSIRIGKDKMPIRPVDKSNINRWMLGVARTTTNGALTSGSTSIVLTSSGDFDESGSVDIAGAAVSDTIDSVAYTTNTESTNTLGTVTGIKAAGHASGAIVWQGASFGYPTEYAVVDGEIVFSQPFSDEMAGENIWMDFYEKLSNADSDGDLLDETNFTMYIPYLRFRIKLRRDKSLKRDDDADFKSWKEQKEALVAQEFLGQDLEVIVDVPR